MPKEKEMLILRIIEWAQKHDVPLEKLTEEDMLVAIKSRPYLV